MICYERTADPADAVTSITAVTADTVEALEKNQIVDEPSAQSGDVTAAAVSISGIEYLRISSKPVSAKQPYYIYRTKDTKAGNPISMLYTETITETQNYLFGTWANEYFFSQGATSAYSYEINEDIYDTLWDDQTVCTKLPVRLLNSFSGESASSDTESSFVEPSAYVSGTEESVESSTASQAEPVESRTTSQEESQNNTSETTSSSDGEESKESAVESETANEESSKESSAASETANEESTKESAAASEAADEESANESTQQPSTDVSAFAQDGPESQGQSDVQSQAQSEATSESTAAVSGDTVRYINLTMLTPRDGLPDTAVTLTGMRGDPLNVYAEKTERSERKNKFQASVFSSPNIITPILGGVVLLTALGVFLFKRHSKKKALAAEGQTNAPGRAKKSKKSGKSKRSRKSR